ncbi:hypothetical protein DFJ74DRAFT_36826 [Hyaloraphidium curvatum]|nr:hypothetical protein DFJ74DRAFT_36826 [Hyaloraphidium curvatum]
MLWVAASRTGPPVPVKPKWRSGRSWPRAFHPLAPFNLGLCINARKSAVRDLEGHATVARMDRLRAGKVQPTEPRDPRSLEPASARQPRGPRRAPCLLIRLFNGALSPRWSSFHFGDPTDRRLPGGNRTAGTRIADDHAAHSSRPLVYGSGVGRRPNAFHAAERAVEGREPAGCTHIGRVRGPSQSSGSLRISSERKRQRPMRYLSLVPGNRRDLRQCRRQDGWLPLPTSSPADVRDEAKRRLMTNLRRASVRADGQPAGLHINARRVKCGLIQLISYDAAFRAIRIRASSKKGTYIRKASIHMQSISLASAALARAPTAAPAHGLPTRVGTRPWRAHGEQVRGAGSSVERCRGLLRFALPRHVQCCIILHCRILRWRLRLGPFLLLALRGRLSLVGLQHPFPVLHSPPLPLPLDRHLLVPATVMRGAPRAVRLPVPRTPRPPRLSPHPPNRLLPPVFPSERPPADVAQIPRASVRSAPQAAGGPRRVGSAGSLVAARGADEGTPRAHGFDQPSGVLAPGCPWRERGVRAAAPIRPAAPAAAWQQERRQEPARQGVGVIQGVRVGGTARNAEGQEPASGVQGKERGGAEEAEVPGVVVVGVGGGWGGGTGGGAGAIRARFGVAGVPHGEGVGSRARSAARGRARAFFRVGGPAPAHAEHPGPRPFHEVVQRGPRDPLAPHGRQMLEVPVAARGQRGVQPAPRDAGPVQPHRAHRVQSGGREVAEQADNGGVEYNRGACAPCGPHRAARNGDARGLRTGKVDCAPRPVRGGFESLQKNKPPQRTAR